ncbi:MAG: ribosome silencing factor [Candidatus Zophobacter franzmannii]|jgi:ribosome-associated protein|nr:ribosome silencing factor [Candidatus Zophobacter franzmannii]
MKDIQNSDIEKIIGWMIEKKADDVKYFDVRNKTDYTDYIILATGANELHLKAIALNVLEKAKKEDIQVLGKEGMNNAGWILIDMGYIIAHIALPDTREHYKFDQLFDEIQKKRIIEEGETNLDLDAEVNAVISLDLDAEIDND